MKTIEDVLPDIKLRFNINNPSYEESYAYGYACAVASLELNINPYAQQSNLANQWEEGWWDGFYGNDPLFPLDWLHVSQAANEEIYASSTLITILKITGTLAASVLLGYQLFEWVA